MAGGSLGTARGDIVLDYDDRGVLRARDSLGRFVSLSEAFGDQTEGDTRRAGRAWAGFSVSVGLAAKIMTIAGAAASALQTAVVAVVGATQAIIPIVQAGLGLLPGIILAAVSAALIAKVAFAGMGDALKAAIGQDLDAFNKAIEKLAPNAKNTAKAFYEMFTAFKPLKEAIQQTAFTGVAEQVQKIGPAFLGVRDGMTDVASGLNGILLEVAKFAGAPGTVKAFAQVFQGLSEFMKNISAGIQPLLAGFAALGGKAGEFMGKFGSQLAGLMTQFGNFLSQVDLGQLLANAAPVLSNLGSLLKDLGTILGAVGQAVAGPKEAFDDLGNSGAQASNGLGSIVSAVADFIKSAPGQELISSLAKAVSALGSAFSGVLGTALVALQPALSSLLALIASLSPALGAVLSAALNALGPAIGVLANALNGELGAILPGLVESFTALAPPLAEIASVMGGALATAVQVVAPILSKIASIASEVLVAALTALVPYIEKWGEAFAKVATESLPKLLPMLEDLAPQLIKLIPSLVQLADAFIAVLVPAMEAFLPIIITVLQAGLPLIALFSNVVSWLTRVGAAFGGLQVIVFMTQSVVNAVAAAWNWLYNLLIGNSIVPDLINGITRWFTMGAALFASIWNGVKATLAGIWNSIKSIADSVWNGIVSTVRNAINGAKAAVGALASIPAQVGGYFRSMASAAGSAIGGLIDVAASIPGRIRGAIGSLGGMLYGVGQDIVRGLANGIRDMAGAAIGAAQSIASSVKNTISSALKIGSPSKVMIEFGMWTGEGLAIGMEKAARQVRDAANMLAMTVPNVMAGNTSQQALNNPANAPGWQSVGAQPLGTPAAPVGATLNVTNNISSNSASADDIGRSVVGKLSFAVQTGTGGFSQGGA